MLRELAPLLAEEGIDINADVPDMDTLQNALNRAVERRNMALFTPVGQARELALTALRLAIEAITTATPRWPPRSWNRSNPNHRTTRRRPCRPASARRSACSTTGCPGITRRLPQGSANEPGYRPGTGPANAPRPTSSSRPANDLTAGLPALVPGLHPTRGGPMEPAA